MIDTERGARPTVLCTEEGDELLLEVPCLDCTTPAAQAERAEALAGWGAWHEREAIRFKAWVAAREAAGHPNAWDPDLWQQSDDYRALGPCPEDVPAVGCAECDFTGLKITETGRRLLGFIGRYGKG